MEENKLYATLNIKGTLSGGVSAEDNLEGNIGKGVTKVHINDHTLLVNRDKPDQHPIDSITGLKDELLNIKNNQELSIKNIKDEIGNKIRTTKNVPTNMKVGQYIFLVKEENN